ncbi:RagB/SusD family nutrient uptake outer membrane protein [Chitinophaga oryzae]|uniref:RagB/SusD family nutrient uptake outer membrane protein n=1 Tax=Chitinophaga oryzae TaxID=2725414 RepID=A0AAE6ZI38_9BACT|nr:RagB/SusD family nutrient uptake outer membrane protein [Chitinophaga oryzae]QJB32572.1 RagB/SusD family nutrient uptake outer membrane protein [Chitinophaga oryzae]
MKTGKTIPVICALVICGGFSACKKYLDVPPDNLFAPVTADDYTALLNGEGWSKTVHKDGMSLYFLDILTADVEESTEADDPLVDDRGEYSAFYTWQNKYDLQYNERKTPSSILNQNWIELYRIIQVCNLITEAGTNIKGDEPSRQFLLGEACFSRALAYYYLINIWGTPYNPANANSPMGVPLKTNSDISVSPSPRNTVNQVYDQILKDLALAEKYVLSSTKKSNVYHYSPAAVYLLTSRVHLYMQHWEQAAGFADKCLDQHSPLYDISNLKFSDIDFISPFWGPGNPEIIYTFFNSADGHNTSTRIFGMPGLDYAYQVSSELKKSYEPGDQRPGVYFLRNISEFMIPKTYNMQIAAGAYYSLSFRTAEAYLNRAEANVRLGNTNSALRDLNLLRANRIKDAIPLQITDPQLLLDKILSERRKELAFQLHNWFDLRRTGQYAVTHYFTPLKNEQPQPRQKFVLQKNDPGYTLELPGQALQHNPQLKLLGLPVRIPI